MDDKTIKAITTRINEHPDGDYCDFCNKALPIPQQFYTISFDELERPSVTLYCKPCSYRVMENL